jgi:hypothetical protein
MALDALTFPMPVARRFPPPWLVEEQDACFVRARPQRARACICLFQEAGSGCDKVSHQRLGARINVATPLVRDTLQKPGALFSPLVANGQHCSVHTLC